MVVKNPYKNQHNIEIVQNGPNPEIKIDGNRLNAVATYANLTMEPFSAAALTIRLKPQTLITEINGFVEFEHDGKKYRLFEIVGE